MKFTMLLITIGLVLLAAGAGAQDSLFAPPVNYAVGDYPVSVFSADFDGDGDFDLAVAYLGANNVSILANNGDGTFAAAVTYAAGDGPHSVFSADFDGDGDSDLVVANENSDSVSVLANNGDGTFAAAVTYGAGDGPYSVFSADFDDDSHSDLAVANRNSDNVSVLKNNGDGTFQAAVHYAVGNGPWSVFCADFDGDSALDLVTANRDSDNISVLLNNGDGIFAGAVNYAAGNGPHSVSSADFDGDDDNDLAVANLYSDNISVLENNGSGIFQAPVNYGTGDGAASVFSVDLDGDGAIDLAVANAFSNNASTLINNGDGTFQAAVNYEVGSGPVSVFSADLDGDGDFDLVVTNQDSDNISVLMNLTDPAYSGPVWHVSTTGNDSTGDGSPADPFATIQHAIDVSTDGDTVMVADGTFTGDGNRDIDYGGKSIVVTSLNGPEVTIIDCQGDSLNPRRGFYFHSGEDSLSVLDGLTITNGYTTSFGGGIYCWNSSPVVSQCIITNCQNVGGNQEGGAALCCLSSNAIITDCVFSHNLLSWNPAASRYGTVFFKSGSSGRIENCIVEENVSTGWAPGIACLLSAEPVIKNCIVRNNSGQFNGGIYCSAASPTLSNCLISDNSSDSGSAGISCYYGASPTINQCTIYGNTSDAVGAIYVSAGGENPVVTNTICWNNYPSIQVNGGVITYCDIQGGYPGQGNINCDPLFCNSDTGDFRLALNSCCAGAGEGGVDIGAFGVGCDDIIPVPMLTLSTAPFFDNTTSYYPLSGDEGTLFEFRINYQDSSGYWPELGYPQLILDWDGNGAIDHANDGYYAGSQSESDSVCVDGTDYSVFTTIPAGGNPQIEFEAVSSSGLSAVYPESGWLSGPSIIDSSDTDLYLYGDDITFSISPPDYPEVGEPVIIYGRVHNNSPTGFDSVRVDLYIDEILAHSFYESLPARDGDGNAGFADIAFDTVFNDTAFVQVAITVDPEDGIAEWNEFNNTAKRSLIIEGFQLPGAIHLNPFALGTYYPMSWVSGGGTAWYEDQGDSLEQLSGTPVYLKLLEGNVDLDTVYINDLGYFSYSFMTPLDTGLYHIELKVTDFTLDAIDTVSFHVVPAQGPDLVIDYDLGGFPLTMCGNTDLTIYSPRVVNVGSLPSGPCKAAVMRGDSTLIDVSVPGLNPGELFVLAPNDLTVTHSVEGYYRVSAVVDYDHEVAEWSECNNSKWTDYRVWCCPEDLQPTDLKLSGVGRPGRPVNILAKVYNQGGQASEGFSLTFVDMCCGSSLTDTVSIGTTGDLSLSAYGSYGWFSSGSYVFSDTGMHLVRVYADSGNILPECREDNNVYSEWVYIQSTIDLYTSYDSIFVDNPDAGEGEQVYFQAKVGNAGDSGAYAFNVYFGLNGSGYTATPNVFVDSLPGGTDLLIEHPEAWTVDFSQCSLEVFVDSGNQVAEYNEGNNHSAVPMPFDFYPYYGYRCPQYGKPSPYFFDTCGTIDTGVTVTISLTVKNAGLFRFNDSLLFSVYDSLAGDLSSIVIHSQYIHGPYEDHARNLVVNSFPHSFIQYGTHFVTVVTNADQVIAECDYGNNEVTDSIIVKPHLPDLVIQSEWIDPSSLNPQLGEDFWVSNVDVYNLGSISAFDVDVLFLLSGDTLDTIVISEIAPGGYDYTGPSDTVVVDTCEPATRIVRVCADPFGLIEEENELNNCATRAVVFCEGVDLYVSQVYFEYDCLCVDSPLTINTVIANNGDLDASAIVEFYYTENPQGGWSERSFLASASVETFSADDSVTIVIPWQVPANESYIYVDISYTYPWDFNPANDTMLVSLTLAVCGDIDGSGSIDVGDLTYLVAYLFQGGPPPPTLEAADVDCSRGIDVGDLTYLVNYLFLGGPPPCDPGASGPVAMLQLSEYSGKCELVMEAIPRNQYRLDIRGDFQTLVAGFQQEYTYDGDMITIDSIVAGAENRAVDVYYSAKNDTISFGMIDLTGEHAIKVGRSLVATVYFHTDGESSLTDAALSHVFTVAADRRARIMPIEVTSDKLSRLIPDSYALRQNFPNPFNPNTIIQYSLPKQSHVNIVIYNILGQKVAALVDKAQPAGQYQVVWNSKNSQGKTVASGVYLYRIEAGDFTVSKKMLLLK